MHGAKINAQDNKGRTALHLAARNHSKDIARLLLDNHIDVNIRDKMGKTAFQVALNSDSRNIAALLIEYGAEVYTERCSSVCRIN